MTQENKHTPAPWFWGCRIIGEPISFDSNKFNDGYISLMSKDGCVLEYWTCYADDAGLEVSKEDALLMQAAPEMLYEMEKLAQALEDTGHEPEQSFYDVIKKAKGE